MPKLHIDGEPIEVPAGTTVFQAAMSRGREIPHYCYHAGLSIAGNCRMCLVEVEKAPKLVISCATEVQDGMVVRTDSERVQEAQAAVQEFLLLNHPLDCPICDQAGECRLQDFAFEYSRGVSRSVEPKVLLSKAVDIGKHILLDQERCIQCSRCIRFCDEVSKTGELAFFQRGERTIIGTFPGKRLDNPYAGNTVDICPVGALTLKQFRFRTRVWYLENTPTICAGCSRGCNVMVAVGNQQKLMTTSGQQDDGIKRIVPRFNDAVNGHWMCDEGRLSFQPLEAAERLRTAQSPAGTALEWDEATSLAAGRLKTAAHDGRAAAILSPRLTCETLFAWKELLETFGVSRIGVHRLERGADDDLLIRADKGANSTGAAWILGPAAAADSVLDAARSGELDVLLVVGDLLDPADTPSLPEEVRSKVDYVIYAGPFLDATARGASLLLPTAAWAEEEGTMVNCDGRVQRLARCHLPRGEGRPGWRVAADVGLAAQLDVPAWSDSAAVLADLAASHPSFEGLDRDTIGLLGAVGGNVPAGA